MAQIIKRIIDALYGFVWGVPALILIIGVGIFIGFKTRFVQIRMFGKSFKITLGKIFGKDKKSKDGSVTPFQAVCTALAATVGTGNIAGVAGAIALGGAGAVFWMWVSALLGMGLKTVEITLSVHFREKNENGEFVGGPMYAIRNGLGDKWNWLAKSYAVMGIVAVFGIGNAVQINTVLGSVGFTVADMGGNMQIINNPLFKITAGLIIAVCVGFVMIGGAKRIGSISEKTVPFMAAFYILLALGVVVLNINKIPAVLGMIFKGAFNPSAVTGGAVGSVFSVMKKGVSRGIFSNEAGLGTAGMAHSSANADNPAKQGLFGIFEVFVDTILICSLTAFVILLSGVKVNYGFSAGAGLTLCGFKSAYGNFVTPLLCIALCSFAFSTVIGWGFYGLKCFEFLFGARFNGCFSVMYSLSSVLGATADMGPIWQFSETVNGLMVVPNLIGVILLLPVAIKLIKNYEKSILIRD